jgi:hypothetical protein
MFGWDTINQHIRLWRHNGWIDETKEEEATN